MKTFINIILFSIFLISCSKSEQSDSSNKRPLKNKGGQAQSAYFSSDIKYQCQENSSCAHEIKLIALRHKDTIARCTGFSINDSTFFDSSCLSEVSELTLEFCKENIEIHGLNSEISKCENIEVAYTSTDKIKYYKITHESKPANNEEDEKDESIISYKQHYILNDTQQSEDCSESFTSLLNFKSLRANSEYLDYKNCEFRENGIILKLGEFAALSSKKIQDNFFTSVNAICLLDECERKTYSQKDKAIEAILVSEYETAANMLRYMLSGLSFDMFNYNLLETSFKYDEEKRVFSVVPKKICRWDRDIERMMIADLIVNLSLSDFSELNSDTNYEIVFLYGYAPSKLMFLEKMASGTKLPVSEHPTIFHEDNWYEAVFPARKYSEDEFLVVSSDLEYGRADFDEFVLFGGEETHKNIVSIPVCE